MYPHHVNAPPPAGPSYYQPQPMNATPYPPAAPYALAIPQYQSPLTFDAMIKKRYADSDNRLRDAISRIRFPSPDRKRQCLDFVEHLRIYRHLFMHTYMHLISCCNSRYLHLLVEHANVWRGWNSVQQLLRYSSIRDELVRFWTDPCSQHRYLFTQQFVISDDDGDLLCHLLYCGKKPELYELLPRSAGYDSKEFEQVIELLWEFLVKKPQESNVACRLRAFIYRLARKSAYIPQELRFAHSSISYGMGLGAGANGLVTKARVNGHDVAVKKILCGDPTSQRKCLEMFASEAILWKTLQHKNIVPFLGVIMQGTFDMGLVSPFFRNGNIKSYIRRYPRKDWPALAKRLGRDLAEGLKYIHSLEPPIIHGDLKGDNVLVDDDGHARLGDFGQSYASDSGKYLDSTRIGLAAYNPVHWMAPEVMAGGDRAKVSDKSDIYSFGCVLYEMLSGKIPYEGFSFGDVVNRVKHGERLKRPDSISRNDLVWKIAKSCWESPENRPTARRLVSSL